MELNLEKKQQLEELLVKPSLATPDHIPFLQQLIEIFPYYQPLHLLLAKASSHTEGKDKAFTKAALYTNGTVLHRVLHEQELDFSREINVITFEPLVKNNTADITPDQQQLSAVQPFSQATASETEVPEIENLAPLANEIILVEDLEKEPAFNEETQINTTPTSHQDFVLPEIENLAPLQSEILKVYDAGPINEEIPEADEQEVFEEINEFIAPPENSWNPIDEIVEIPEQYPIPHEPEKTEDTEDQQISDDGEEELVIETVAATDFFAFDRSFSAEALTEKKTVSKHIDEEKIASKDATKDSTVSKYDDDQLPFTFLWWLAKTRKDHDQIFRPFASPVATNAQPLQQQYVEHIFHLQAPLEPTNEEETHNSLALTKENEIIDNFIKNDPQIKALKPDQINNENKAKRSAEDANDVVSETLAQIYIEQMLYHKAIGTYQKLSLKFPEKSGYFADLIQSLEKKI